MNKLIRVFLSRPNPFTKEQKYFLDSFKQFLKEKNIETVTLQAKDYSPYDSLTILNEMIKRCYGMIIIAFGHTYIEKGSLKKGGKESEEFFDSNEKSSDNIWITSPFCQIEGAMAISNSIPILIIKQKNLREEGILKKDEKMYFSEEFDLVSTKAIDEYLSKIEYGSFKLWLDELTKIYNKIENSII